MRTTLQVTAAPATLPVGLGIAKQHCRIDHASDDDLLQVYIGVATSMAEQYLSRALITQTLLWTVTPEWPVRPDVHFLRGALQLPRAPVQSITSVVLTDQRGNVTTITPATLPVVPPATLQGYVADLSQQPATLVIGLDTVLVDGRTVRNATLQHLQVQFVAGYGVPTDGDPYVAAIPEPIKQAILLTIAHLYEHRGDTDAAMPRAAEWLLDPYRIPWIA